MTHWKKPARTHVLRNKIQHQVRPSVPVPIPQAQHIKITNLPGEPLVKLGGPLSAANNGVSTKYLKAHVFGSDTRASTLFPQGWLGNTLYVPSSWQYRDKNFWYRGMLLHHTEELKNILINGLELDKTRHAGIFASSEILTALLYAANDVPTFMALPVLIRIPKTSQLSTPAMPCGLALFSQDIPANFLTDVMVFLEVGGKPGWYKVTLENGELVFTPVSSRIFADDELIEHKLDIPKENRDW